MKGSEHLFGLALTAEAATRNAYQADAHAAAGATIWAEMKLPHLLDACDKITMLAAKIRTDRGEEETKADVFALVLSGQLESGGQPGQWRIVRDGSTITYEDFSREG